MTSYYEKWFLDDFIQKQWFFKRNFDITYIKVFVIRRSQSTKGHNHSIGVEGKDAQNEKGKAKFQHRSSPDSNLRLTYQISFMKAYDSV